MSLGLKVLSGAGVFLGLKFINRGIGLLSMFVLARLLAPEDFGIVALVSVVVHLFASVSNSGINEYIVRKASVEEEDLATAWTLNICIKLTAWLLYLVAVPYIAEFYDRSELELPLLVVSLLLPISACGNVGIFLHYKELNYRPIFNLELSQRIATFAVTISIAILMQNYWAMIAGVLTEYVVGAVRSYSIHPYRPRLSLKRVAEQWQFSKWIMPRALLGHVRAEVDTILVGKLFDTGSVGGYTTMKSISGIVGRDVTIPATQPLLAVLSRSQSDTADLGFKTVVSVLVISALVLPIVCLLQLYSESIVAIVFGDKWVSYASVLSILSVTIATGAIMAIVQRLMLAVAAVRALFWFEMGSFAVTAGVLTTADFNSLDAFAWTIVFLVTATAACQFLFVSNVLKVPIMRIIPHAVLVVVPASAAVGVVGVLPSMAWSSLELMLGSFVFGIVYTVALLGCLLAAPESREIVYIKWLLKNSISSMATLARRRLTRDTVR